MTTFSITASTLLATTERRTVELEELEVCYKVRALVQVGLDPETARVFAFSGAERSRVIELGKRWGVLR